MGIRSPRTFDELLRYIQEELALQARRRSSVTRDDIDALNLRLNRSEEWAAKGAPLSFVRDYTNRWGKGIDSGGTLDADESTDWIRVNEAGVYHARAVQRGTGVNTDSAYLTLALDGNRAALENRADGMFTHDHAVGNRAYSESEYLGFLPAGSVITAGASSSSVQNLLTYGSSTNIGSIMVRRIS